MAHALDLTAIDPTLGALLTEELDEVVRRIETQVVSDFAPVNTLCLHVGRYHGKMLRPLLVLLSGMAVEPTLSRPTDAHRTVGGVVELIHLATLVHDDVLDEAAFRRGGSSVNRLHGVETSVMLGDYLLSNAFHMCSTLGNPAINTLLGRTTNTLCEGEVVQLHHRGDLDLDEQTYMEIVARKTASLIASACELGALLAHDAPASRQAMAGYGLSLGIAFQITDDLLDLDGQEEIVGKPVGRDLAKGKLTLPTIRALAAAQGTTKAHLVDLIQRHDRLALRTVLEDGGWIEAARVTAADLVTSARQRLDVLPDSCARAMLHVLANGVLDRNM
jgi:octaprenyl-diphosphate synthase